MYRPNWNRRRRKRKRRKVKRSLRRSNLLEGWDRSMEISSVNSRRWMRRMTKRLN